MAFRNIPCPKKPLASSITTSPIPKIHWFVVLMMCFLFGALGAEWRREQSQTSEGCGKQAKAEVIYWIHDLGGKGGCGYCKVRAMRKNFRVAVPLEAEARTSCVTPSSARISSVMPAELHVRRSVDHWTV